MFQDDEDNQSSKLLIKVLPQLFQKHQTDAQRVAGILSIVENMNLGLYLDMRMSSVRVLSKTTRTLLIGRRTKPFGTTCRISTSSTRSRAS